MFKNYNFSQTILVLKAFFIFQKMKRLWFVPVMFPLLDNCAFGIKMNATLNGFENRILKRLNFIYRNRAAFSKE